jgi:hypothetical protein
VIYKSVLWRARRKTLRRISRAGIFRQEGTLAARYLLAPWRRDPARGDNGSRETDAETARSQLQLLQRFQNIVDRTGGFLLSHKQQIMRCRNLISIKHQYRHNCCTFTMHRGRKGFWG